MNKFISTETSRQKKFEENIKTFFNIDGKIKEIVIISAYFDLETIDWIYEYVKTNNKIKVQIFIDRYSSKVFSNDDIYKKLTKAPKNIDIFLVTSGKLFHSKLYYIKSDKKIKISIGSLNFTYNAFQKNEEILNEYLEEVIKENEYVKDIEQYISNLKEKSEKITSEIKNHHTNDNLRSLLLNGLIYYESKEQESVSFKLKLPNDLKQIGTDIDSTLEANIVDSLTLERLVQESPSLKEITFPQKDNSQSKWKDYCIETCYGYWSPSYFHEALDKDLKDREKRRKPYFDEIKKLLQSNEVALEKAFLKVCKKIKKNLKNNSNWDYSNKQTAKKAWKNWRNTLLKKLNNKNFYNRLILGVSKVSPPDVWSDVIASEEFENSFLDSIIYRWSKESKQLTSNKIAKKIALNLKRNNEDFDKFDIASEELKKEIENWLVEYINNDNNIFVK